MEKVDYMSVYVWKEKEEVFFLQELLRSVLLVYVDFFFFFRLVDG